MLSKNLYFNIISKYSFKINKHLIKFQYNYLKIIQ